VLNHLRPAVSFALFFMLLTGFAYPLAVTGIAQMVFPQVANGSLVEREGKVIGSSLIAQPFAGAAYLHPRASASGWNAAGTGASNLGPTSAALLATVAERRTAWETANGAAAPIDAVTASGSGLDPDISPENALAQTDRIADARGVDAAEVRALIEQQVAGRSLGLYGERRVNVLMTNLALDAAFPLAPVDAEETATE
jgi:K+-transporting ATPase ATPase C chain